MPLAKRKQLPSRLLVKAIDARVKAVADGDASWSPEWEACIDRELARLEQTAADDGASVGD